MDVSVNFKVAKKRLVRRLTFVLIKIYCLRSRFLPALLTAVLTNHLAWVPTVMPNGQPPIKIFLEKHSSQSVDMLAKTHPYNPLWAQLGEGLTLVYVHTQHLYELVLIYIGL